MTRRSIRPIERSELRFQTGWARVVLPEVCSGTRRGASDRGVQSLVSGAPLTLCPQRLVPSLCVNGRVVGLALVALGVGVIWGVGFGLIVAGAGVWVVGVELPVAMARDRWLRARTAVAAVPRRAASIAIVTLGLAAFSVGLAFWFTPFVMLAIAGPAATVAGVALGWE